MADTTSKLGEDKVFFVMFGDLQACPIISHDYRILPPIWLFAFSLLQLNILK